MGDDVLTISRQLGMPAPASTLISSPALGALEELRWRSQYIRRGVASSSDPVAQLVFSFFENKLFRIVIYASDRTEGMTEADVVAAVSRIYGPPAKRTHPPSPVGLHPQRPADSVVAQWTDTGHRVALLAVQDQTAFRLIVSSVPLEALAALTDAARFSGSNSKATSLRGYLLARGGRTNQAREVLRRLESDSRERYVPPGAMALVYAGLGERDAVMEWLAKAYDARDAHLVYLPVDPKLSGIPTESIPESRLFSRVVASHPRRGQGQSPSESRSPTGMSHSGQCQN
jgi:hypothetical protein